MKHHTEGPWTIVPLPADLRLMSARELGMALDRIMAEGRSHVILDATRLVSIDSYGIGIIVTRLANLRAHSGDLRIFNLGGEPLNLVKRVELAGILVREYGPNQELPADNSFTLPPENSGLRITTNLSEGALCLQLEGNLRYPKGIRQLRERVLIGMADQNRHLLDLRDLEFMDSYSAGSLANMTRLLATSGGEMRLCNPNEVVQEMLQMLNITQVVSVFDSVSSAMAGWQN